MAAWITRALVVSVVGGLLVFGWWALQPLMPSLMPLGAGVSLFAGTERIGRPPTAPVVRSCISGVMDFVSDTKAEPSAAYFILKTSGWQAGIYTLLGMSDGRSEADLTAEMASKWGQLASCIYAQEGRALCDSDSRAAAVETITRFMLYAKQADFSLQKAGMAITAKDMRTIEAARRTIISGRLLSTLRTHRRDGIFVASDFGLFPPAEIRQILREEKEIRYVCKG